MLKLALSAAVLASALAPAARSDDAQAHIYEIPTVYPYVAPPQEVAQTYLSARTVVTFPPEVSGDGKTAVVTGAIPSGALERCRVTMTRTETDPSKINGVQWRVTALTCPIE